jgi:hypothetical protein
MAPLRVSVNKKLGQPPVGDASLRGFRTQAGGPLRRRLMDLETLAQASQLAREHYRAQLARAWYTTSVILTDC